MSRNITLNAWDQVYLDLRDLQQFVGRVQGGRANKLARLLADALAEAERIAPGGWLKEDVIGDHDIRVDARVAVVDALTDTAEPEVLTE